MLSKQMKVAIRKAAKKQAQDSVVMENKDLPKLEV